MPNTPIQAIVDTTQDSALNVYSTNNQTVPVIASANVTITNTTQYITEIFNLKAAAGGNAGEIEFNNGSGLAGDTGLTYDADTDSLTVTGNVFAGNIRTDNLLHSNGTAFTFAGSTYSNSNVSSYLPTFTGTVTASLLVSSGNSNAAIFNGSGAGLTNLAAGNIVGTVANATHAATAAVANSVAAANVSGTVTNASHATVADSANSVAGANVTGTVSSATSATTATTITANAQPNITSTGTLTGLTVSGNISVGNIVATGNANVARFNVSTTANLGAVGNITITGGTSGQYLQTDGSGHLAWASASATTPNLYQVTNQNGTTNVAVSFTNTTDSTNYNTGAVKISGGLGVAGNIHSYTHVTAKDTVFVGNYADFGSWTIPKFIGRDAGAAYIQGGLVNDTDTGSADWVAYGDSSSDSQGWADFGYTGTAFNDPAYTITKPGDGYFIVQGLTNGPSGPLGGNLVIATGGQGANSDIVFAVGDFLSENEYARMDDDSNTFYVGGHAYGPTDDNPTPRVVNLDVNGNVFSRKNLTVVAQHGNIVVGDATASASPGLSSTTSLTITANRGGTVKEFTFTTDGDLAIANSITATANVNGQYLHSTNSQGDEGGEILLAAPSSGTTIAGSGVTIDIYKNKLRIFEQGGDARGGYFDITELSASVGTNLLSSGGGTTLPTDAAGYLHNDGAGTLTWSTSTSAGSAAYSDVWLLSDKGSNASFWTTYSLTGDLVAVMGGSPVSGLSAETVYGKQIVAGSKTLIINNGDIQTNTYGIVIEFPSSPTVGDTFASPVTGGTSVSKLIFKPASGQKGYVLGGTAFGTGAAYIGAYVDISTFGSQPITWVYAGSISGTPTWYQLYF